jgi:hypothetical protein
MPVYGRPRTMTTLAVMQPTYMPWMGYFGLIDQVDTFIFLDDVQLARQSWQTRNKIRGSDGKELMLSIPVRHSGELDQALNTVQVNDHQPWRKKHGRTIQQAYARAPHGAAASDLWQKVLENSEDKLGAITQNAITTICDEIGISTDLHTASDFARHTDRTSRLIALCSDAGADTYLSPLGALDYLREDNAEQRFTDAGLTLKFQTYEHPNYDQGSGEFLSHLGIVDLLAFCGLADSLTTVRAGRRPSVPAAELTEDQHAR